MSVMMHDGGGGSGSWLAGRTQREILAYLGSPALTSLDAAHDMWNDIAARAGGVRDLIEQRLDQLTAEGGWTGPGAEAYRQTLTQDLLAHLATLQDTAEGYAQQLEPVTGAVSSSHTTGENNNIPWDVDTTWTTRRQHVDQSFWGHVDEFFTGEDEAYEEAKANAPTEVINGCGGVVATVPKERWDSHLALNGIRAMPTVFNAVNAGVTPEQDRFDRVLEAEDLNAVPRGNVSSAASSVNTALSSYQPATFEEFTFQGGGAPSQPSGSMPGGGSGPAGGNSGDGNGGGGGGSGANPTPPGGTTPLPTNPDDPGNTGPDGPGTNPGNDGPGDDGQDGPGVGTVPPAPVPDPEICDPPIGHPDEPVDQPDPDDGPVDGIIGDDPRPTPLPVGERGPGTEAAGIAPPSAVGPIGTGMGGPAIGGPAMPGTAGMGGIGAGPAGGGPMAPFGGGRMATGTPGTSFQLGSQGRATVNPGAAGHLVGTGSDGGRGGMAAGAPMGARRSQDRDEEKTTTVDDVWLEEDEDVWGAGGSAPPSVIR